MHELGIVFSIIKRLETLATEQKLSQIHSVTLELGEVSGVLPDYLTDGWNWAIKKSEVLRDSSLIIETLPAVTLCNSCSKEYKTIEHGKTCPFCNSEDTVLLKGTEMNIKQIEAE